MAKQKTRKPTPTKTASPGPAEEKTLRVRAKTNLGLSEPDVETGFLIIRRGEVAELRVDVAKRLISEGKAEKV